MQYEVEQKFRLTESSPQGVQSFCDLLIARGAEEQETVFQVDTYFAHPERDFAKTDEALRIRQVGETNCVTYKGPKVSEQTKARPEIEIEIAPGAADAKQFSELLTALSFTQVAEVRKTRQVWHYRADQYLMSVAVDEVEQVGSFVELEIVVEKTELLAAEKTLLKIASDWGLCQVERRSYLGMLLENEPN